MVDEAEGRALELIGQLLGDAPVAADAREQSAVGEAASAGVDAVSEGAAAAQRRRILAGDQRQLPPRHRPPGSRSGGPLVLQLASAEDGRENHHGRHSSM